MQEKTPIRHDLTEIPFKLSANKVHRFSIISHLRGQRKASHKMPAADHLRRIDSNCSIRHLNTLPSNIETKKLHFLQQAVFRFRQLPIHEGVNILDFHFVHDKRHTTQIISTLLAASLNGAAKGLHSVEIKLSRIMIPCRQILRPRPYMFRIVVCQQTRFDGKAALRRIRKSNHWLKHIRPAFHKSRMRYTKLFRCDERSCRVKAAHEIKTLLSFCISRENLMQNISRRRIIIRCRRTPHERNGCPMRFCNLRDLRAVCRHHDLIKKPAVQSRRNGISHDGLAAKILDIFSGNPLASPTRSNNRYIRHTTHLETIQAMKRIKPSFFPSRTRLRHPSENFCPDDIGIHNRASEHPRSDP